MKRFIAVLKARNLEFVRDRAALSWTIFMPFFLIIGFAVIFSGDDKTIYKVGVLEGNNNEHPFLSTKYIQAIPFSVEKEALKKLTHHRLDMVIKFSTPTL